VLNYIIITILSILAIIFIVTAIQIVTIPARRPTSMVKEYILRLTPIGTSINDVVEMINNRDDWGRSMVNYELGFEPSNPTGIWGLMPQNMAHLNQPRVGVQSAFVNMGTYRTWLFWPPFAKVEVNVFWGFDADGKLIEVHVDKIGMI